MADKYEKGVVLGRGTFGSVYKAVDKQTGQSVAVKRIDVGASKEGVHMTTLREVKLLRELGTRPHIVSLLDVYQHKKKISLVFEFLDSDLEAVIKARGIVLAPEHVKTYMQALLRALSACHCAWVVHRDIKPNNVLVSLSGEVKLADFGLARVVGTPDVRLTHQVFARWYRPPELLFGASAYGTAIDIWAAGCVMAELLLRRPWLPGTSDVDQLARIFQALGTPTRESWPGCEALPCFVEFSPAVAPPLRQQFPQASTDALDLLGRLVALDPRRRPTADEALRHPYFTNAPLPASPGQMPKPPLREDNPLQLQQPPQVVKVGRPLAATGEGDGDGAARAAKQPRLAAAVEAAAGEALGKASPMVLVKS